MLNHPAVKIEMNFCRRCGHALQNVENHVFKCEQGHVIFANASPAIGVWLVNDKAEVIVLERAIDPGKGLLDAPGGYCDGAETLEAAIARELQEEIGVTPEQYEAPEFLCSRIDPYDYAGETLPTLGIMFTARLKGTVDPKAADDAAAAYYVPLADINLTKVYFPAVRAGLERLRQLVG